jgi:hypothetical protein
MFEIVDYIPWWGWLLALLAASLAVLCVVAINAAVEDMSGD